MRRTGANALALVTDAGRLRGPRPQAVDAPAGAGRRPSREGVGVLSLMGRYVRHVCCLAGVLLPAVGLAQSPGERCIALELYVRGDEHDSVRQWARDAVEQRRGVSLRVFDVAAEGEGRTRFDRICAHFKQDPARAVPALYGCAQLVLAPSNPQELARKLDELRTMTVFVRSGCPRCARTKEYLKRVEARYPGFRIVYRDVVNERSAQSDLNTLAQRYRQSAVSVPVFHYCDEVLVGFDGPEATGRRLEAVLDRWTFDCSKGARRSSFLSPDPLSHRTVWALASESPKSGVWRTGWRRCAPLAAVPAFPVVAVLAPLAKQDNNHRPRDPPDFAPADNNDDFELPLPPVPAEIESDNGLPLPDAVEDGAEPATPPAGDEITLPLLGTVRASELGLPLFTLAVGLVDGFNPCAMWVLLFLLSILVNLQSRWKIMAVAGTFVVVSGMAYFAFMAAWLNVVALLGFERPIQVVLGSLALVIGSIHVKDFFAFKKGITLSIPESAKPGIAARVRRIVMAENVWGAILGAITLAVLVNTLELLCTAGLPALYTAILHHQGIEGWSRYGYLGLYNAAYMFDDTLMLLLVVITLDKTRLQEKHGRWLKLLSGAFVLALGLIMLIKPDLLQFV